MMDPVLKAKWVEALRSGKYKQGHDCLEYEGENCCLGVLARVIGIPAYANSDNVMQFQFESNPGATGLFADHEKYGLDSDECLILMDMNDVCGNSFAEIADYIETSTSI